MSSRKVASVLSPRNKSPTMTTTTITTSEYVEAVQTLNESALKQACEWLIDDLDSEADEKILGMYYKCESALKIIQKQQPAFSALTASPVPLPGAPNLNLLNGSQSQLPKLASLTSTKKGGAVIAKGGVIPMRRTAMPKPGGRPRTEATSASSDLDLLSSSTSQPLSKKARVAQSSATDNPRAPPTAALKFLAKLNKDGNSSGNSGNGKAPSPANATAKRNPQRAMHRRSSA
jgi:hypothetical protein